ncbi:MATE family efflux transporter [Pseudomonas sp. Milli4]|uniref:Multidrug-efflux transporter n=2 Tax=Pseudomonas schmalbachii TaxID=2816993 RepID=A0ABS3TPB8_9PSED|nr:MATE family efflux transporter [Pseudomonas schmalbachii]
MLERQRLQNILGLGLPIIGGMLSQSLLNLVDAAMVGHLGEKSLAGVGIGSYANFVAISLVMGLGAGVQALVARRRGEGRLGELAGPLNCGLLVALGVSLPITLICMLFAGPIVQSLSSDPEVLAVATPYFEWRALSVLAVGLNFSFRGYWNGTRRSGMYMRTLVVMHLANAAISYSLIHGLFSLPRMGAVGSGFGTTLALYLGTLTYASITWRDARQHGFLSRRPCEREVRSMLRLSLPNSLQQFFFAAGITLLFWIIGQVGTRELAVAHVLINLALFLILPGIGLGMAATTLVSQSMGEGDFDSAHRWGWDVVKVAACGLALLGTPFWLFPETVLRLFISDPGLIELGRLPLMITGIGMVIDATALVLTQALLGAGATRTVMAVSLGNQWLFFLPLAYLVGPVLGGGLLAIWSMQIIQRGVASLIFAVMWQKRQWTQIEL